MDRRWNNDGVGGCRAFGGNRWSSHNFCAKRRNASQVAGIGSSGIGSSHVPIAALLNS